MPLSIILAEDHKLFRNGLRQLLEQEPDFRIVGEADNGLEAQRLVTELRPDLLILDLSMPGGNGLEAIARVRKLCPHTRILVISMHDSAMHVRSAFREGAHGYLLKTADSAEFFFAVQALAEGRQYVSSELTERMVAWSLSPETAGTASPEEALTLREREVLKLVAEGLSNKEIADRLHIAEKTVVTHRGNFMRKLDLHNVQEVTMYAIRNGILPVER